MQKLGFLVYFLLFCTLSAAQTYTLHDAIHYALEHSPTLGSQGWRDKIAELDLQTKKTAFYPSLDLTSQHGLESVHPRISPNDPVTSQFSLTLSEKLYDNGESLTKYSRGKLEREVSRLTTEQVRDQLALDVATRFYEYSLSKKVAEATKEALEALQKQFTLINRQYRQGIRLKKDFLRFKAQTQRADIDYRTAANTVEKNRVILRQLLGISAFDETMSRTDFKEIEVDALDSEIPSTSPDLKNTFEYRIAKTQSELAPFDVDLAKRLYWPQLLLTTGATYGNSNYLNSNLPYNANQTYGWNIGLALNYNIWDWGTRKREVEKANANQMIAENDFQKTSQQINADILSFMIDLSDLKANYTLSKELLRDQEDAYNALLRDLQDGQVNYIDLSQGLQDLISSKTIFYGARYHLAESLIHYRYYEGKLYETVVSK